MQSHRAREGKFRPGPIMFNFNNFKFKDLEPGITAAICVTYLGRMITI